MVQFNGENPIKEVVNSVTTLFFKENFMKIYENNFISLLYQREVTNGVFLKAKVSLRTGVFRKLCQTELFVLMRIDFAKKIFFRDEKKATRKSSDTYGTYRGRIG